MQYGAEKVFTDQTELPVYRVGVDGFWTHNGFWGNHACPLSPRGDAFAVRALDLNEKKSYVMVLELDGKARWKRLDPYEDIENGYRHGENPYHGGDVFWDDDGTRVYGKGLLYGWDAETGEELSGPHPGACPAVAVHGGSQIANIDYARLDDVLPDTTYGLFEVRPSGTLSAVKLVLSVRDLRAIRSRLHPDWAPLPDVPIDAIAVKWNKNRDYFQFNLGNHVIGYNGYRPPLVREVWVSNTEYTDVRPVIPYVSPDDPLTFRNHSSFRYPAGDTLCGHTGEGVAVVNRDGTGLRYFRTGVGGGHPSISPDGNWVISDSYGENRDLFLIDVKTGNCTKLLTVPATATSLPDWWRDQDRPSKQKGPGQTCLHPNWSADGKKVTFNAMFGPHCQVCLIDLSSLM